MPSKKLRDAGITDDEFDRCVSRAEREGKQNGYAYCNGMPNATALRSFAKGRNESVRAFPRTMRLALAESGPSFEQLVERALNEQFGAAVGSALSGIWDLVLQHWHEGASPIVRLLKAGIGTSQHGQELKLMRKLPAWFEQANQVKEQVLLWQERMDTELRKVGARLSGAGWSGIDPALVAELSPTWRVRLADILVGNVKGMDDPATIVESVESLFGNIAGELTKLLARSGEARRAMTNIGFERHMEAVGEALARMREAATEASVEAKKLKKISKVEDDQEAYVAMANDLIESLNDAMEAAQKIAVGLVDVIKAAIEEVPAQARRGTSLIPHFAGSEMFPGRRPGLVLRRAYDQAAE